MSGEHGELIVDFGKYRGCTLAEVPDSYLRWCLEQDWFEGKYAEYVEPFEDELRWRDVMEVRVED
jgi:uncharacterized protein (DUF3820 family)